MRTLKTLQITVQYLFLLVFLTCLSASCIRGYKNIYAKENYCTQNSLDFKKFDHQTKLFSASLIKFENDNYTLGVFRDSSKTFVSVDYSILLKNLETYGVNFTNLAWFGIY